MRRSVKVSVAMKRAKMIQYIIHRTWGSHGGAVRGGWSLGKGRLKPRKGGWYPEKRD